METNPITSKYWLDKRSNEINSIVKAMLTVKSFTVKNPVGNLNVFHETLSSLRETQEFARTYFLKVIDLELEAKRFLGMAIQNYKDAMAKAFVSMKDKVDGARSFEEKELRLREFLPEIKERENWEGTLESIKLLKEAVDLVYQDLSKAAMALNLQVGVLKNQILTGEIRIAIGEGAVRSILSESTLDSMEKVALKSQPNGSFNLDDLVKG